VTPVKESDLFTFKLRYFDLVKMYMYTWFF
jgi:hypothetical protein